MVKLNDNDTYGHLILILGLQKRSGKLLYNFKKKITNEIKNFMWPSTKIYDLL